MSIKTLRVAGGLVLGAAALAIAVAAPVSFDLSTGTFGSSAAFAKHGADDKPGDDRGGRNGGHGADDGKGHH